jgi:hypothetical protein
VIGASHHRLGGDRLVAGVGSSPTSACPGCCGRLSSAPPRAHARLVPVCREVRATISPLGLRRPGECGNPGLGAAIASAVADALGDAGVGLTRLPLVPTLVWEAARGARRR